MRFVLIDRILGFEEKKWLKGIKNLSLAEEYLKDHFPQHPVMPGVLMLESLIQASAWLIRLSNDFQYSTILLEEARTIRYRKFVSPADQLLVETNWVKELDDSVQLNAKGSINEETVVSAKLKLRQSDLAPSNPSLSSQDKSIKTYYRNLFSQIYSKTLDSSEERSALSV